MIDDSGEWWKGSEPADIEEFLHEYTRFEEAYPSVAYRLMRCACGADSFKLVRARSITQRTCLACRDVRYVGRWGGIEHWQEAVTLEPPEPYRCVECLGELANVMVGFAKYGDSPELDSVKWFYVGARCANCGILECFNDGKVGRGPFAEVIEQIAG